MATSTIEKITAATTSAAGLMSAADKTKLDKLYQATQKLAANTDLNTIKTPGIYTLWNATYTNAWDTDKQYGQLIVINHSDGEESNTIQFFYNYTGNGMYVRGYQNSAWRNWTFYAIPGNATQSAAGLMSSTDKTKLDGIASGADNVGVYKGSVDMHDIYRASGNTVTTIDKCVQYVYENYLVPNTKAFMFFVSWVVFNPNDDRYNTLSASFKNIYIGLVGNAPTFGNLFIKKLNRNLLFVEFVPHGEGNFPRINACYSNSSAGWGADKPMNSHTAWGVVDSSMTKQYTITPNSGMISSGTITCCVRNGWAYVCVTGVIFSSGGDNHYGVASGFPAPKYRADVQFCGEDHTNTGRIRGEGDVGWINPGDTTLNVHLGVTNLLMHYGSFSYPVA